MDDDHRQVANDVVAELEAAHAAEDVVRYVALFSPKATWITSRGVLIEGRDALSTYLAAAMPGGLAGGSVEYRPSSSAVVGQRGVIVIVDQVYRGQDGNVKTPGGQHRHTYVIDADDTGAPTIVAGQNTTVADPS